MTGSLEAAARKEAGSLRGVVMITVIARIIGINWDLEGCAYARLEFTVGVAWQFAQEQLGVLDFQICNVVSWDAMRTCGLGLRKPVYARNICIWMQSCDRVECTLNV